MSKKFMSQVQVGGKSSDLWTKAAQVEVTYNGKTTDLASALEEIFGSVATIPTTEAIQTLISTAISKTGHASFETVDAVPTAAAAKSNVMYLVMNDETGHYDIYAKVGSEVVRLDDTTVDLSGKADKSVVDEMGETVSGLESAKHTHANKAELDKITSGKVASWDGKADKTKATTSADGLMSKEDKAKLDTAPTILVLAEGAAVPSGTPDGTLIIREV